MSDDPFAALRARFRERCADDATRLRAHLAGVTEPELEKLIHRLAGTAGTFGYGDLGLAALAIDEVYAAGGAPTRAALEALADRLEALASD